MKRIENSFKQDIYTFETPSGLSVYLVHRPGFKRSCAVYGTPYGALNLVQEVDGETVVHPSGVAHFLEHKLFEDDKQDVLSQFAEIGANANAFTSYEHTMYYFSHNGDIEPSLRLLIQFVSHFGVSAESVEKEKGIIVEELMMYEQMPQMRLINETYRNVFHKYPFIYDIGGTPDSVRGTTLDDLKRAYDLNYNDARMVLSIVTPYDLEAIKAIVLEETANHPHANHDIKDIFEDEPETVVYDYREIVDHVEVPKMSLSYKYPYTGNHKQRDDFLLNVLLEMNFSEVNPDFQTWRDEGLVSNSFGFGTEIQDQFVLITFLNEGEMTDEFRALIDAKMQHLEINEQDFEQLSRRYYGEAVMSLGSPDDLAIVVARSHYEESDYFAYLEMIKNVKISDIQAINETITTKNSSFLVMKKATI